MIYYDFHIHSALSPCGDADMTPNNIVNMAMLLGLDAIAISDHNSVGNVEAAQKVGEKCGIRVLAGMEIETQEEVHILTLYPDISAAREVEREVQKNLPDIKNRPEIFGEQIFINENDEITGYEEKLLISPTAMPIEEVFALVKSVGGIFVPAHVDRHSYSILTNLGFIPEELPIKSIEISTMTEDVEAYMNTRKELNKYKVFRNSDAHYLDKISEKNAFLDFDNIEEIFKNR